MYAKTVCAKEHYVYIYIYILERERGEKESEREREGFIFIAGPILDSLGLHLSSHFRELVVSVLFPWTSVLDCRSGV